MRNLFLLLMMAMIHGCGCAGVFAQVNMNSTTTHFEFINSPANYVINPMAALNTNGVNVFNATKGRVTGSTKFFGKSAHTCDTTANGGYCRVTLKPVVSPDTARMCTLRVYIVGDATLHSVRAYDTSLSQAVATVAVGKTGTADQPLNVEVLTASCAGKENLTVDVIQTTAGTSPAIEYMVVWARADNIGPYTQPSEYSASVSATGVVTNETPSDWINGNFIVSSTYVFTGTFNSQFFTSNPNCTMSSVSFSGNALFARISMVTTTSLAVESASSGPTASGFTISCTKTGADIVQTVVKNENADYPPRPYTPIVTGLGTVTGMDCTEARLGVYNIIDCKFITGTVSAVEARVSLPPGRSSVTYPQGIRQASLGSTIYGVVGNPGHVLIESNVGYLTFGLQTSTNSGLTKVTGSSLAGSTSSFSFRAMVQIDGWQPSQGAFVIPTNINYVNETRNFARMTGSYSQCTSSPCTAAWSAGISSVTRTGTGVYVVNVPAGACSQSLACTVLSNAARTLNGSSVGTTGRTFTTQDGAGAAGDAAFTVDCTCPRD